MEDKRTAIAIFLCIMVVMIYSELVITPYYQRAAEQHGATPTPETNREIPPPPKDASLSNVEHATVTNPAPVPAETTKVVAQTTPTLAQIAAAPFTKISTPNMELSLSHLGARVKSLSLVRYREALAAEKPLETVLSSDGLPLPLGVYVDKLDDANVTYTLLKTSGDTVNLENSYLVGPGKDLELTFEGNLGGTIIRKIFKFRADSYLFEVNIELGSAISPDARIWLEWTRFGSFEQESERLNPLSYTLLDTNNKIAHTLVPALKEELTELQSNVKEAGSNQWISLGDKYFSASLVASTAGLNSRIGRLPVDAKDSAPAGDLFFSRIAGQSTKGAFSVYVGPKDDTILSATGFQLHRTIDLGFFSVLAYPLLSLIRLFHALLGNYGLAIILLTLAIKTAFLPLTATSMRSMKAMQELQPEIKALRDRIKDPTQLNQEMAGLFKKRGVNPMGGCLPMLIQIPIFFGLYSALFNSIELRHAPFALWIKDLSSPEHLTIFGIGIPIMVLLMGLSMFIQQRGQPQAGLDPAQQKVMKFMPIIFTGMFIVVPMPAGLVLYWLVNNTISIIQQTYLRNDKKASPLTATLLASAAIFSLGFVLTLI